MPPPRTPDPSVTPSISLPSSLHAAYLAAPGHPPLSQLLQAAVRSYLTEQGIPVPPPPPPRRTAAATRASALRRSERPGR